MLFIIRRNEGYPTVISEAQGCGLPVVCSDAVGVPEAVGDCGLVIKHGVILKQGSRRE